MFGYTFVLNPILTVLKKVGDIMNPHVGRFDSRHPSMIARKVHTNPPSANPGVRSHVQFEENPGAEHGEHIKNTAAICNTSASHTYGNIMSVIQKYVLDRFPKDLFKSIEVNTALASRQLRHTPRQLHKLEPPIMILSPRIHFGQDDRFLSHTLINSRFTDTHQFWNQGSLLELGRDIRKRLFIHGHYNRAVMNVDFVLSFNTYAEQVDYMHYIHQMIPIGHNQFIRAPLELYIPDGMCKLISNIVDIPIQQDESVYKFLTYMNGMWFNPITYKLKGGSNSDEFFMYYVTDIDAVFLDVQHAEGVKDGQSKRAFNISFTVRCEFNTIGYFTINSPTFRESVVLPSSSDEAVIVPILSDVINLQDFSLPQGWSILSWPIFRLGQDENSISIKPLLNQSLNAVIDHHLRIGIPMEKFIQVQFRENGQILQNDLFYIDWKNRKLVITRPNWRRTYRLIITISQDYINSLIKELYNLE